MRGDAELSRLLKQVERPVFRSGFTDRVIARLEAQPELASPAILLTDSLQRHFLRLLPIAALLVLALGAYNLAGRKDTSERALDAVLGLPAVTLAAAYTMDPNP